MSSCTEIVKEISNLNFPNAFNPYRDHCPVFDFSDSPRMRRGLLMSTLEAACALGVDAMWIGRDLGYRGGRRTGLALTDQVHVETHLKRWGLTAGKKALVKGNAQAERTASVVWQMLQEVESTVFMWNVFPLHPHDSQNSFSNRAHTSKERIAGEEILDAMIHLLKPRRLIAIGQDAAKSATRCAASGEHEVIAVRHPSYGGLRDFQNGLREAYGLAG